MYTLVLHICIDLLFCSHLIHCMLWSHSLGFHNITDMNSSGYHDYIYGAGGGLLIEFTCIVCVQWSGVSIVTLRKISWDNIALGHQFTHVSVTLCGDNVWSGTRQVSRWSWAIRSTTRPIPATFKCPPKKSARAYLSHCTQQRSQLGPIPWLTKEAS